MTVSPRVVPFPFLLLFLLLAGLGSAESSRAGQNQSASLGEAQAAFDRRDYSRALSLAEPLSQDGKLAVEALRLMSRSELRLGRRVEALSAYEKLADRLQGEDRHLLREVSMAFVTGVLTDMREQMRGAGYTALKESQAEDAFPYFIDGLSDGSGLVRALAAEGLGRSKSAAHRARLQQALEDQAAMVRVAVLKAFGRSGDASRLPVIEGALKDDQATVRMAAYGAMVRLGRKEAWNRVREGAEAPNPEDRAAALRILGDLGDRRALPILLQALSLGQPSVRGAAASALGELGDPSAGPALAKLLTDPIPAVRAAAAVALGEIGAPDAAPALKSALGDSNPAVRAAAVSALLHRQAPFAEVAGTVRDLIRHTDPGIRASAAKALSKATGKDRGEAIEVLRLLTEDPLPRPRIAAIRTMGQIGGSSESGHKPAEIIAVLRKSLRDQDEAVRATAGGAVLRLLGQENRTDRVAGP